jgi:hypothetical protein
VVHKRPERNLHQSFLLQDKSNVVKPVKGVWRAKTFVSSNKLTHWIILNLDRFTKEDSLRLVK